MIFCCTEYKTHISKFHDLNSWFLVFMLTHLPETQDKYNWIQTSENYEQICLNK